MENVARSVGGFARDALCPVLKLPGTRSERGVAVRPLANMYVGLDVRKRSTKKKEWSSGRAAGRKGRWLYRNRWSAAPAPKNFSARFENSMKTRCLPFLAFPDHFRAGAIRGKF